MQLRNEDPELAKGATKALLDLYDVVTHDLPSSDLRYKICYSWVTFWISSFLFLFSFSFFQFLLFLFFLKDENFIDKS